MVPLTPTPTTCDIPLREVGLAALNLARGNAGPLMTWNVENKESSA